MILNLEKNVLKGCVVDINIYLQNLVETCDSLLAVSVQQHLVEKLKPVYSMLNCIDGVSESDALPKQGVEPTKTSVKEHKNTSCDPGNHEKKPQPKSKDPNGNEASGSKGKGILVDSDDEE
ncbi:unnamed protein product [Lactuca saligna]|uniref:Uncharacterized protein n=1 Tax=Lactuca saligna TaxID=75948 RepID=A0AA35YWV4_LACSI|nr:unnamed protein product [Lactuca saligna]